VLAVLCFHAGFPWAVGGYLGVSTFFTLSGFLITSLLLAERQATSTISLRSFWGRRLRRLMPASLAALGLVVAFGLMAATNAQKHSLGGGVTSSLLDVSNWYFVFNHQSYADLFSAPSPVLHFWSLAIEEQFYLLFPLLAFGLLARLGLKRRGFGISIAGLMGLSLLATLALGFSRDRIYFGTDTRAFELLAGCLLAVVISGRHRISDALHRPGPIRLAVAVTGAVALVLALLSWSTTSQGSGWLYHGGLSAYSLLSVAVILAATLAVGPVSRLLGATPLRSLGMISYGVYLFHWPIFLWLDHSRTGLDLWPLFGLRLAVTLGLALVSYRVLEQPVRQRRFTIAGRTPLVVAPAIALVLCLAAWSIAAATPAPAIDFQAAQRTLDNLDNTNQPPVTPPKATRLGALSPTRPARVAAFGDSTALVVGAGIADVDQDTGLVQEVPGGAWVGCGLGRGGYYRSTDDNNLNGPTTPACDAWPTTYAKVLDQSKPDLAVMMIGPWEVADRKLAGDNKWRSFGDPVYDKFIHAEMLAAVDLLSSRGATVVWLTSPPVSNRPERTDRLNQMLKLLPSERPGKVVVVDLASNLASRPDAKTMRPDGIHLSGEASHRVANDFLIPRLAAIWRQILAKKLRAGTTTTTTGG
jgi:peptidoglycan/LPS O-acetylase OafA/YrhL